MRPEYGKKKIDWDEIRRRISSIDLSKGASVKERDKILKARAKALAAGDFVEKPDKDTITEVVEFMLAYEKYGIASEYISEIYPLSELTALPCTPPFVLGIINARGKIMSVIDIKKFFGLPEKGLSDLNKVVVLRKDEMEFGILADSILSVRNIEESELEPGLPTLTGIREEYLKGITRDRTVILDGGKLLADNSIIVHENVEI